MYSLKCEGTKPPANDWHIAIYTESNSEGSRNGGVIA